MPDTSDIKWSKSRKYMTTALQSDSIKQKLNKNRKRSIGRTPGIVNVLKYLDYESYSKGYNLSQTDTERSVNEHMAKNLNKTSKRVNIK
jgi:hypothetical protein